MGVYDIIDIDIICPYCDDFIKLQTKSTNRCFRRLSPGDFVQSKKYYGVCGKKKPENFIIHAYGSCNCQEKYRYEGLNTWVDVYIPVIGGIIQSEYKVVWKQDIDEGERIKKLWNMYRHQLFEKERTKKSKQYTMIPKEVYDKNKDIIDKMISNHIKKEEQKNDISTF